MFHSFSFLRLGILRRQLVDGFGLVHHGVAFSKNPLKDGAHNVYGAVCRVVKQGKIRDWGNVSEAAQEAGSCRVATRIYPAPRGAGYPPEE